MQQKKEENPLLFVLITIPNLLGIERYDNP